jgi:deoxyribodipyrimidine photo-lyase
MSENGLFIFRRDFRVVDNNGLNLLNSLCKRVYPVFIFTPEQVSGTNKYKSNNAVQFMIESLQDLAVQIRKMGGQLLCFYGHNNTIISNLIKELDITILGFNADYTPYAIQRELEIIQICDRNGVQVQYAHDYYLHPPGTILNGQKQTYQKFTPYYTAASKKKIDSPAGSRKIHFATTNKHLEHAIRLDSALQSFTTINPDILVHGGRNNAIKQLRIATKNIKNYSRTRDTLSLPTSHLSAYIKFGCVSIREVYKVFRAKHEFIRQLYWRDFYMNILYSFPNVLEHALKPKYDKIHWHYNENWFNKWAQGKTGFPVVDAAMTQLNTIGYMENRARLIVASFLVKTLLISWQKGAQYFSQHLIDYDPVSNQLNWQWVASSGPDSQPYFRIFNPWLQQSEHDTDCVYIKRWIPELADVPNQDIHNWETAFTNYKDIKYPKPMVNYAEQKEKCLKMYKDALY